MHPHYTTTYYYTGENLHEGVARRTAHDLSHLTSHVGMPSRTLFACSPLRWVRCFAHFSIFAVQWQCSGSAVAVQWQSSASAQV